MKTTSTIRRTAAAVLIGFLGISGAASVAAPFDGTSDYGRDDLGYYYAVTGGKFVNGQTATGVNSSTPGSLSGTMRFVTDDPAIWGRNVSESGNWQKDGWFTQTAGLALTMRNNGATVFDNNGIEDGTQGNFYDAQASGTTNANTPGLYRGYSMSNNYDWVYAGYFKIEAATTVTEVIGYFDENSGFDRNDPNISFRMNVWSNVNGDLLPVNTGGFNGDVLDSDSLAGTLSTSDTGVNRVFADGATDDIFRVAFALDAPLTLQPGEYWFSHDAAVPEPAAVGLLAIGGAALLLRRRRRA